MTGTWSLLDWLANIARNPEAQAQLAADPPGFLQAYGFDGLSAEDVHHAIPLVADTLALSFDGSFDATAAPPDPNPLPGETVAHAAVRQISYLTENFSFTDDGADPGDVHELDSTDGTDPSQTLDAMVSTEWPAGLDGDTPIDDGNSVAYYGQLSADGFFGDGNPVDTAAAPAEVDVDLDADADEAGVMDGAGAGMADASGPDALGDDPDFDSADEPDASEPTGLTSTSDPTE